MTKNASQKHLRKEEVVLAHSSGDTVHHGGGQTWRQEPEAAGHNQEEENRQEVWLGYVVGWMTNDPHRLPSLSHDGSAKDSLATEESNLTSYFLSQLPVCEWKMQPVSDSMSCLQAVLDCSSLEPLVKARLYLSEVVFWPWLFITATEK